VIAYVQHEQDFFAIKGQFLSLTTAVDSPAAPSSWEEKADYQNGKALRQKFLHDVWVDSLGLNCPD